MIARVQMAPQARVEIASPVGMLRIGRGRTRPPMVVAPGGRVALTARAASVEVRGGVGLALVGGRQGPAGRPGPQGTGVEHLEPRIEMLEGEAVRTGVLDW